MNKKHFLALSFGLKVLLYLLVLAVWMSCSNNSNNRAVQLLHEVSVANQQGQYDKALGLVDSLRRTYPKAIEQRKKTLEIYKTATEKKYQSLIKQHAEELRLLDERLAEKYRQVAEMREAGTAAERDYANLALLKKNRDSIQARFDAECAVVRKIRHTK